tara:strand:- start:1236 stop:1403 length:168 start_codon:yes stop_codon:yes gene_type:complete
VQPAQLELLVQQEYKVRKVILEKKVTLVPKEYKVSRVRPVPLVQPEHKVNKAFRV